MIHKAPTILGACLRPNHQPQYRRTVGRPFPSVDSKARDRCQPLSLSVAMMGAVASFVARLLQRHLWIAYVGLAVILYIAVEMTFRGTLDIMKTAATV